MDQQLSKTPRVSTCIYTTWQIFGEDLKWLIKTTEQTLQPFLELGQVCFVASGVCLTERNKKKEEKETDEDRHTAVQKHHLTKAPLTLLLEMQTGVWVFA